MTRGLSYYLVGSTTLASLLLTPTTVYSGRWGITSHNATQEYENKNPKQDGRFLNNIKRRIRENPDGITKKLIQLGDPTKATEKVFDILKRRKDKTGTIPNTGIIRRQRR